MKSFVFFAVLVHILFLLSIFYIYFQSPIQADLPIGRDSDDSVANRVIVFVADGLRAESFLKHQANRTKYLQSIINSKGAFGISHTHVPTESRPGHVALFAGLYEDPSAVFKGWKENPVEFDSVFNRSYLSFTWGSPDILNIFSNKNTPSHIYADFYPAEDEQFSQTSNTSVLDIWVFDKVKQFLKMSKNRETLQTNKKVVLFLHLLGLDTSGHVHKPYSSLFTENLMIVDEGIRQISTALEEATNHDGKTAFIFTSDHGMTDRGSHGSGQAMETETPFVAWGAGIQHWKDSWVNDYIKTKYIDGVLVPSWDINQADVAPLIASLLGLAIPKNNCGKLPRQYLNTSEEYIAESSLKNTEQLYQKYYHLKQQHVKKLFEWKLSNKETNFNIVLEKLRNDITEAMEAKNYQQVISLADVMIDVTTDAIDFYHTYYKYELLISMTISMVGWICNVVLKLLNKPIKLTFTNSPYNITICGIMLLIVVFNTLQGTPALVIFYFVLPCIIWMPVLPNHQLLTELISFKSVKRTITFIGLLELCVFSFFHRQILSLLLVMITVYLVYCLKQRSYNINSCWIIVISNLALSTFPMIPVVDKDAHNSQLLVLGLVMWLLTSAYIVIKSSENLVFLIAQSIVSIILATNMVFSIIFIEKGHTLNILNQTMSWVLLVVAVIIPLLSTTNLSNRIKIVMLNMACPYLMLSLSYEPLFLLVYCISLYCWIFLETKLQAQQELSRFSFRSNFPVYKIVDVEDIRRSFMFVVYILISFFGTGNMATVSSFDPNWVRFFVTTFSPFTMAGLIVFKLIIPIYIAICVLKSLQIITAVKAESLFLLIFIACDLMCLQFFYLIKNTGSWLEIGSSISHFIIMESTTIMLLLMYGCAKFSTELSLVDDIIIRRGLLPYSSKTNKD
ncbi:GPI ethanolamine phosphate transferase 1 [Uranotaenia lowii]|uniref:GPI ethanolamine phosphate transferase 1 n=1 Tax=Uranotaenia lowii TaxID=190385 RepID=UPI002479EFC8|nr:GPI ethanolamine phosphate transferase 1 [Uranotaenia lowii]XP_055594012.1 GPI ethanolamine phosphate transferase 1 [Uranotaenia lowii]